MSSKLPYFVPVATLADVSIQSAMTNNHTMTKN